MPNLDSMLKNKDITLVTKICMVKGIVFPVVMYGCEIWSIKKAECWRINVFELWCWSRLLRVPWTATRSNQWILKEINPEYSLERLKLKLQYFGHLTPRANSLEKTLILGKSEGKRRRGRQRMRWLDDITDSTDMRMSKLRETVKNREVWHAAVHGVSKSRTQLSKWTTTTSVLSGPHIGPWPPGRWLAAPGTLILGPRVPGPESRLSSMGPAAVVPVLSLNWLSGTNPSGLNMGGVSPPSQPWINFK